MKFSLVFMVLIGSFSSFAGETLCSDDGSIVVQDSIPMTVSVLDEAITGESQVVNYILETSQGRFVGGTKDVGVYFSLNELRQSGEVLFDVSGSQLTEINVSKDNCR